LGRIPDETLQRIRDRVDIVDLVGRFVSLRRSGRSFKGLCPFHDEKTPSFSVNPERGSYYCFGCNEKGNAFTFLMHMENLTFPEAARALAQECGIAVPETDGGERGLSERLHGVNELAQSRYRRALAQPGNPGAAYLAERGIDDETIERFGLGFAPEGWEFVAAALREEGIPAELGERAGLLAKRNSGGHYDRLRGRVTFPISDVRGRVIGFGGRAVAGDAEPKYLNTPESPVFRKREAFYGFPRALEPIRRAEHAVVVEGYFDLIALHRAGIEEAVATCGTALTPEHGHNLRRRTRRVVLLFDGDESGQRAAQRSLEVLLPLGLRVRAAVLPPGDDPDSFLAREGAEALRALIDEAPAAIEVAIRRAVAGGCEDPWQKDDAVAAVVPLLALISSAVERGAFAAQLALAVGSEPAHVEAALRAHARGEDVRDALPAKPRHSSADMRKLHQLVRSLVEHPHLAERLSRDEVSTLVQVRPLAELISTLIEAAGQDRAVDVAELGQRLSDEASSLLHSFAADGYAPDEASASRTVDDTLRWLRERYVRERQRAITEELRNPDADVAALLREKEELRERAAQNPDRHPPTGSKP
jgi:DNA primase